MASIGELNILPKGISLGHLKRSFPSWGFWTQPRQSIMVPDRYEKRLLQLVTSTGRDPKGWIDVDDQAPAAAEGTKRWVAHLRSERSTKLRNAKRSAVLRATGRLACEACDFDFRERYGDIGEGFCEVHHDRPLGTGVPRLTTLRELKVLCSNCHRAIHRTQPLMRVTAFRKLLDRDA
jgi:predicted HNH restriction endonuclease